MPHTDPAELGSMPKLGDVPDEMQAQVIRPERYGDPQTAFAVETVATPRPGPGQVLVYVMAAGVNYNNVWAALGGPVDVVGARRKSGESEHMGIRDQLGELRAVHARPGAPAAPQVTGAELGRGRRVHAGRRDRVS